MNFDNLLDRHNRRLNGEKPSTKKDDSIIDIGADATNNDSLVTFLDRVDWQMVEADHIRKHDPEVAVWQKASITSKNDVNGMAVSSEIRKSYVQLRTDFLLGIYYRLDFIGTANYAYILMFEFLDLFKKGCLTLEQITNIKDVLVSCCTVIGSSFENQIRLLNNGGGNKFTTYYLGYCNISFLDKFSWKYPINLKEARFSQKDIPDFTAKYYVCNKQDICQQIFSVKRAYQEIREDFFKGILYNLNRINYRGYAFVLMYDILDSVQRYNQCTLDQLDNIGRALAFCCKDITLSFRAKVYQVFKPKTVAERIMFMDRFKINYQYNWALLAYKEQLISEAETTVLLNDTDWGLLMNCDEQPDLWAVFMRYYAKVTCPMGKNNYEWMDYYDRRCIKQMCLYKIYELVVPRQTLLKNRNLSFLRKNFIENSSLLNKVCGYDLAQRMDAEIGAFVPDVSSCVADVNFKFNQCWKEAYAAILESFRQTGSLDEYWQKVETLVLNNRKCSNLHMLYGAIAKDMYKSDPSKTRAYYIKGCLQCFRLVKLGTKAIGSLFGADRYDQFSKIIDQYVTDKNVAKARTAIDDLFTVKAKKLAIDTSVIDDKLELQQQTAEMLAEILNQEEEPEQEECLFAPTEDVAPNEEPAIVDEIPAAVVSQAEGLGGRLAESQDEAPIPTSGSIVFTEHQQSVLDFFKEHNFRCACDVVLDFIQDFGEFGELFIDSLNECCFESFDDNLIEQVDDDYVMNEDYFHQLFS